MKKNNARQGRFRTLDLFSGIGGFSLGLERAGMETVAFCEIEPFCQRVLNKHWPGTPVFGDVKTLSKASLAKAGVTGIDVICGGFPCQDISSAGNGAGIKGSRSGLWSEFSRLIGELRPQYVLIENVSMLRSRGLNIVLSDLNDWGYDAEWHCIPASAINCPHQRNRIWIIAWPQSNNDMAINLAKYGGWLHEPIKHRTANHVGDMASWKGRIHALGNAVVPQIPQLLGIAILKHRALREDCNGSPAQMKKSGIAVGKTNKLPWHSGKMAGGRCMEIPALCKSRQKTWIPTPMASDSGVGNVIGRSKFLAKPTGRIAKVNPNGREWNLSLAHWARFHPTPLHRPNAPKGAFIRPICYQKLNPNWVEWLMGFDQGWTELP